MKKRLLSIFTALVLCLTLLPTAALADTPCQHENANMESGICSSCGAYQFPVKVESTGGVEWVKTLQEAFSQIQGGIVSGETVTITLFGDVVENGNVEYRADSVEEQERQITIDLNGKTLTTYQQGSIDMTTCTVTILNGTVDGGIKCSGGKLTVESGVYKGNIICNTYGSTPATVKLKEGVIVEGSVATDSGTVSDLLAEGCSYYDAVSGVAATSSALGGTTISNVVVLSAAPVACVTYWNDNSSNINTTYYKTFSEALAGAKAVASGNKVKLALVQDCAETTDQSITRDMTLDFAGKTLTVKEGFFKKKLYVSGTVTIQNTASGSSAAQNLCGGLEVQSGSTVTISGGTFDGTLSNAGTLEVSGGTFNGGGSNFGTLEVSGGTFNGGVGNYGTLEVSGGTFNGSLTNFGTLDASGGIFTASLNAGKDGEDVLDLLVEGYGYRYYRGTVPQDEWHMDETASLTRKDGCTVHVEKAPLKSVTVSPASAALNVGSDDATTFEAQESLGDGYSGTPTHKWYLGTDLNTLVAEGNMSSTQLTFVFPDDKPVGTYYVCCVATLQGYSRKSNVATVTVSKPVPTVTAPVLASGLTYNGEAQALVTVSGTTNGGEVQYSTDNLNWSTSIPTKTNPGEYTVYWRVTADDTYAGKDAAVLGTVNIAKATVTITAADKSAYAGSDAPDLSSPVLDTDYTMSALIGEDTLDSSVTITLTCDADMSVVGEYDIVPTVTGTDERYDFNCVNGKLTVSERPRDPYMPTYPVNVPNTDNGTVSVSPPYARNGNNVTITVTPDKGYALESLTVIDGSGRELPLTNMGNGKYIFKMPAGRVDIRATFMEDNTMLNFFVDVTADKYYYNAVLWAATNGIAGGVDGTHFAPDATCTRAQLVTFLWRAAGCPVVNYTMDFTDVDENAYYGDAIRWAASLGIVGGYGDGLFGTDDDITREQMATILYRFARAMGFDVSVGEDTNILSYNDALEVSDYALEVFQWAVSAGIVQGADGYLMPAQSCSRAQIVTMLYRLLGE